MALQFEIPNFLKNIFSHSKEFDTGLGKVRTGANTIIVAVDGTGDTDDIEEGINLLPSGGGVVYIKEGTYIITNQIDINIANTTIIGAGRSTIISTTSDILFFNIQAADIVIDSLKLLRQNQNQLQYFLQKLFRLFPVLRFLASSRPLHCH